MMMIKAYGMITLVSLTAPTHEERCAPDEKAAKSWFARIWPKIVDWLTDPIAFPGKWPVPAASATGYNSIEGPRVDDAASATPRHTCAQH